MASRSKKRGQVCSTENCGSRRFHEGNDGYTYCDQGHQQSERGAAVVEDTGELIIPGRIQRRVDSDAESTRTGSSFTGAKALEYYFIALQLVLRKQIAWLISQGLPDELEAVSKDLWALRLRKFENKVSYDSGTDTEGQSQFFSSQSEGESGTDTLGSQTARNRKAAKADGSINLGDTIALCYIGILLLRIPLTVADLIRAVDKGQMPYYRAAKVVPSSLKERLPGTYQGLLEPQVLLTGQTLQRKVNEVASLFHAEFGMELPAINHPLVLHCWTQELALPIEVYAATTRMARMLDLDFCMKLDTPTGSKTVLSYPEVRLMALLVVATKLLFRMNDHERFPVSGNDFSALKMNWDVWVESQRLEAECACRNIQGADSDQEQEQELQAALKSMSFFEASNMSEKDLLNGDDHMLDQYLTFAQDNAAGEDVGEKGRAGRVAGLRRTLTGLFPTGRDPATVTAITSGDTDNTEERREVDDLKQVQQALQVLPIITEAEETRRLAGSRSERVLRPGQLYHRLRETHDLDETSRLLYTKAAILAGITLEGMVKAVFSIERKVQKHEEELRRNDIR